MTARTPTVPSPAALHRAIYLGPMAQVTDDFGNIYRRGAIATIAARDWEMLSASPSRDAFLLLGPDVLPLGVTDAGCCAGGPR